MKVLPLTGEAAFRNHRRGARRSETPHFTAFVLLAIDGKWRFSVVASKARIGGAVERNRAKRRLRAAFATVAAELKSAQVVVLYAKKSALTADFAEIVRDLKESLERN